MPSPSMYVRYDPSGSCGHGTMAQAAWWGQTASQAPPGSTQALLQPPRQRFTASSPFLYTFPCSPIFETDTEPSASPAHLVIVLQAFGPGTRQPAAQEEHAGVGSLRWDMVAAAENG